jgi:hypothetical protein
MAGFTSPAVWLGYQSPRPATQGYITLPWWQAGGGDLQVTRSGKSVDKLRKRKKLQEQFERERKALFDSIFAEEITQPSPAESTAPSLPFDNFKLDLPEIPEVIPQKRVRRKVEGPSQEQIKQREMEDDVVRKVNSFIERHEKKEQVFQMRQQLIAAVHKELKLREEEELLMVMLLQGLD